MSLALYRRYRPESFADVVGQEHVTEPLMQALRSGRVNHAYLFSGPRGCGKTTSARILARCLNCEQGPTPTPCGECPSCRDLARGGPGSLDVIEIDAASHGGVDDARDLRERVTMSPVRDRYRVYIIDEAHMVSTQGFNALLKVVEEPPEHVKFVFATTEPDKVLQTIRSRTHHYAFRLVPPDVLVEYLGSLCEQEGVPVGQGVLPLVVRAGQGSVRDSLSVLDQLIAGAEAGLDYATAVALLGYTDAALLDDVIDALGAADGASLFGVVNRVIESGHDPRRFVEDLLERLRDLILVQVMGPAADGVLRAIPPDQLDRMRSQSAVLGAAELSRAADVTNLALAEMVGASSPRMHLELLAARLLLPSADSDRGVAPRLERVERRLSEGVPVAGTVAAGGTSSAAAGSGAAREVGSASREAETAVGAAPAERPGARAAEPQQQTEPQPSGRPAWPAPAAPAAQGQNPPGEKQPAQNQPAQNQPQQGQPPQSSGHGQRPDQPRGQQATSAPDQRAAAGLDTERVRHSWSELLGMIERRRRATWMILNRGASVLEVSGGVLRLAFADPGTAKGFAAGRHLGVVEEAVRELFGVPLTIEVVHGPGQAAAPPSGRAAAPSQQPSQQPNQQPAQRPGEASGQRSGQAGPPASRPDQSPGGQRPPQAAQRPTEQPSRPSAQQRSQASAGAQGPSTGQPAGGQSRQVSTVDAWGVPFGDEPPAEEPPPDDWPTPRAAPRSSDRARNTGATGAPAAAQPTAVAGARSGSHRDAEPAAPGQREATEPSAQSSAEPSDESSAAPNTEPSSEPNPDPSPEALAATFPDTPTPEPDKPEPGKPESDEPGTGQPRTDQPRAVTPDVAKPEPEPEPAKPLSRYELLMQERTRSAEQSGPATPRVPDEPSRDDADAEDSGLVGPAVVERMLGGTVIDVQEG